MSIPTIPSHDPTPAPSTVIDDTAIPLRLQDPSYIVQELEREDALFEKLAEMLSNQLHRLQTEEMILRRLIQNTVWEVEGDGMLAWQGLVSGQEAGSTVVPLQDDDNDALEIAELRQLLEEVESGIEEEEPADMEIDAEPADMEIDAVHDQIRAVLRRETERS